MLDHLDSDAVRRWVGDAVAGLAAHRDEIDRLNVFPVADSDTGTNMLLTLEAAAGAVQEVPEQVGLGPLSEAMARGALLGARGNSGIILSQLLRGWADVFDELPDGGPVAVRRALRRSADQAYAAVSLPVEGTMLTVARAAADGADGTSLREVVQGAVEAARSALARTTDQLEVLTLAGVVDAGGKGVVVVLESLWATVQGRRIVQPDGRPGQTTPEHQADAACASGWTFDPSGPAYEVMYLVDADEDAVATLRGTLVGLGDSVVVVGGPDLWKVHVHTDQVADVLHAGHACGSVRRLRVTSFGYQHDHDATRTPDATRSAPGTGTVGHAGGTEVVALGPDGIAGVLADHGARAVLVPHDADGWSGPGLAEEIRRSVLGLVDGGVEGGEVVVIVPDRPDAVAAVQEAVRGGNPLGRSVTVIGAGATVQMLAAVAVHDPAAPAQADLDRMRAAMALTRSGSVRSGDLGTMRGLVGAQVVVEASSAQVVAEALIEVMVRPGDELVTVVTGASDDARAAALCAAVSAAARGRRPQLEIAVVDGRLPGVLLEVGVE